MFWTVLMILFLVATGMLIIWSYNHLRDTIDEEVEMKRRLKPDLGDQVEKDYFDSGALRKEVTFRNGSPVGIGHEYYIDGRLHKAFNYMSGFKEYLMKEYNPQGQLILEEYYKMGKLTRQREFDRDGHVTSEKHLTG